MYAVGVELSLTSDLLSGWIAPLLGGKLLVGLLQEPAVGIGVRPTSEEVPVRVDGGGMIPFGCKSAGQLKPTQWIKTGGWIEALIPEDVAEVFFGQGRLVGGEICEAAAHGQV